MRVGVHANVGVTFGAASGGLYPAAEGNKLVHQVYTAALDLASLPAPRPPPAQLEALARSILRSAYGGTLDAALTLGSPRVYLTCVGGGVFVNKTAWIVDALVHAWTRLANSQSASLDVTLVLYSARDAAALLEDGRIEDIVSRSGGKVTRV